MTLLKQMQIIDNYGNEVEASIEDSDPDWANVSVDWSAILNKPSFVLQTDIGLLANLNTSDKTSIVAAINEVKSASSSGGSPVKQVIKLGQSASNTYTIDIGDELGNIIIQIYKCVPIADVVTTPQTFNSANASKYTCDKNYVIFGSNATLISTKVCPITKGADYDSGLGIMRYIASSIDMAAFKNVLAMTEV